MKDVDLTKEKLNAAQRQAVDARNGPFLVVAGAGTGKTHVIVERISTLISSGISPARILGLTFTEKAASEMLDRVNDAGSTYELEIPIMTFNAYGESLLRQYAADIGLGRNFKVMGEGAQLVFLRQRLDELGLEYFSPVGRPDALLSDISGYFSRLKQSAITPEIYNKYVSDMPAGDRAAELNKKKYEELAKAYGIYLNLCRQANVIDYDDQIYLVIELFNRRPNVLQEVQAGYDYVMVDEFQDTNKMQSVLIDMIAGTRQNLFVVGDDDQSIYGWRGATLANILSFKQRYPAAQEITLIENYRSSQEILDSAYRLISRNNPHRLEAQLAINKKLRSSKTGPRPLVYGLETLDAELQWITEDIKQRLEAGVHPGSIAVLARRNITIQKLRSYLDYAGIDYVVIGQSYELYQEAAVRVVLEAIRTVVDPLDAVSLYHTLTGPLFALSADALGLASSQARKQHIPLREIIASSSDAALAPAREAIGQIAGWQELSSGVTVGKLAYDIIDSTGYKDKLFGDSDLALAATRLSELFGTFKEFEQIALQPTAMQYIDALPALQAAGEGLQDGSLDLSEEKINLLTIHKSKGLEWSNVYIADCTEGSFPVKKSSRGIALPEGLYESSHSEADDHMYEERRLMYVAMTRAKDRLVMTYADRHSGATTRNPSRFLEEALGDLDSSRHQPVESSYLSKLEIFEIPGSQDMTVPEKILKNGQVNLSVSQAIKYISCPLDFYYCFVLNVPQDPDPSLEYGSILHGILQDINTGLMNGEQPDPQGLQLRLVSEWPKLGYASAHQRERALSQAQATLKNLCQRVLSEPRVPLAVEEPFKLKLDDLRLTLSGRFDAVFPHGKGVEIVDYKTSTSVDTPEKAKQRANASEQLTLYALAWQSLHDELPNLLTLDFIDTGMKGSLKKTPRGIEGALARLEKAADGIRGHDFGPGKDHLFCQHPRI